MLKQRCIAAENHRSLPTICRMLLTIATLALAVTKLPDRQYENLIDLNWDFFRIPWYINIMWPLIMLACNLAWLKSGFVKPDRSSENDLVALAFTTSFLDRLSDLEVWAFVAPRYWKNVDEKTLMKIYWDVVGKDFGTYLVNPASSLHSGAWNLVDMRSFLWSAWLHISTVGLYKAFLAFKSDFDIAKIFWMLMAFIMVLSLIYVSLFGLFLWFEHPLTSKGVCEARIGRLALQIRKNCKGGMRNDLEKEKVLANPRKELENVIRELLKDSSDTEEERKDRNKTNIEPIIQSIYI